MSRCPNGSGHFSTRTRPSSGRIKLTVHLGGRTISRTFAALDDAEKLKALTPAEAFEQLAKMTPREQRLPPKEIVKRVRAKRRSHQPIAAEDVKCRHHQHAAPH